jgi:transcriptional regulator with XRE-family HTH domain
LALSRLIDADTRASILQALGRPRAHNRPSEQITIYFVGDYDLSFLKEELPGVILEEVPAFLICHQAGTQAQINRWKILEAVGSLVETGRKLANVTQKQVAEITQVTQSRISQIAAKFGGWKALKRILATLLEVNNSDANNSKSLADDELWIAQTYLPLACDEPSEEAINEVVNVYQTQGSRVFLRLLAAMPIASQAKLLSLIVEALPQESWELISEAATG